MIIPTRDAEIVKSLDISSLPMGELHHLLLHLVTDGMGLPLYVPILVARGREEGPILGVTAAVHGNELNGIPVIQRLFHELEMNELKGTVVGVPVVNVPALHRQQRRFIDGTDLNHVFPGRESGNVSEVYAYRVCQRIVRHFDYLIDLHTASFGRINSYYIRADLSHEVVREMALLQNGQIIVHKEASDGTLRGAADEMGIPAITSEVGDPHRFQKGMIRSGLTGVFNVMSYLKMIEEPIVEPGQLPVMCASSYWIYTSTGGILRVHPALTETIQKGEVIASLHNIFGGLIKQYRAPQEGVVIGKSVNPINQTGGRILHLGILED